MIMEHRNFHIKEYEGRIIMQATKVSSAKKFSQPLLASKAAEEIPGPGEAAHRRSFRPPGDEGDAVGSPALLS